MKQKKSTKILYAIWFASAILAAILTAVAIFTDYDEKANYFLKEAPVLIAALICAAVSLISGIAAAISVDVASIRKSPFPKRPVFLPTAFGYAMMIIALVFTVYTLSQQEKPVSGLPTVVFTVISLVLALYYSILSGQPEQIDRKPTQTAGFGLFAILAPLCINVHFYFDVLVEMNAPLKLFLQIALLLAMLYYTSELRYLLKKPTPRLFLMLSAATVSVGSLCALSLFAALIASHLSRLDYIAGAIVVICVMITALIRMASLFSPEPILTNDEPNSEAPSPNDSSENI